jgi:hypothetical protein
VQFHREDIEEVLCIPAKSLFKHLILETPLWSYSYSMSSRAKSPLEGLKASECENGKLGARPPIPYLPPADLIKKREGEQIKVKMPDGTNFSMAALTCGTNEDYLVHVIAVLRIIEKKGLAEEIKAVWLALPGGRKKMAPFLQVLPNESKEATKFHETSLEQLKGILKAKKRTIVAATSQAYKMLHLFVVGDQQTQWDKIMQEMHTKDPWVSVDGVSHKGICVCSWSVFLDCIKLHKLTIFPVDAAEKQRYYMTQTVKKPQQVTVRQYMARMGILNDYLAHLPTVFNSSMAVMGTKKGNVPFDEASLAGIVLNSVPVSWLNQYNMTHQMLPSRTRALLQDLEPIEQVMDEKHKAGLKAKAKDSSASVIAKGSSKKRSASRNPSEQVPKKGKPSKFCQHCKAKGGPHLTHNTKECCRYDGNGDLVAAAGHKPGGVNLSSKLRGNKQMVYLMAAVESVMKKRLKKVMKSKKCKRNCAYNSPSSSDSDSE